MRAPTIDENVKKTLTTIFSKGEPFQAALVGTFAVGALRRVQRSSATGSHKE
jgi:hypothetical protein